MVTEHRASFLVSCAAPCGCKTRLARPAGAGNGISASLKPGDLGGRFLQLALSQRS
jgi:hypothetical protein